MGFFKKKADPISERERAIAERITSLEAQIQQLSGKLDAPAPAGPRLRSTARPHGAAAPAQAAVVPPAVEPIFETVDQDRLKSQSEPASVPEHFNELGVRKYDLAGARAGTAANSL
jgi:hypothetical protein